MFKLRLISTLVLLPLAILGILYLPNLYIAIISGIIVALAAWEWLHMTVLRTLKIRLFLFATLIIVAASFLYAGLHPIWLYYFSVLWWLFAFVGICYFPNYSEAWRNLLFQPFVGLIMFVPAWLAFNTLQAQLIFGPIWVLLGCALIWGADIGAYCFGKLWGKAKLIPKVSPGKTVAGLYGAFFAGCVIMLAFYFWFQPAFSLLAAMWLAIVTVGFAVIGDLFESMLKRIYGFKDSGTLIPGHGGVYDRLDSMLAAFPIYFLGLQLLQNIHILHL